MNPMPDPALRARADAVDDPVREGAAEVVAATSTWVAAIRGVADEHDEAQLEAERALVSAHRKFYRSIRTAGKGVRVDLSPDGLRIFSDGRFIFGPPILELSPPPPAPPTPPPAPAPASVVVKVDNGPKTRRVVRDQDGLIESIVDESAVAKS